MSRPSHQPSDLEIGIAAFVVAFAFVALLKLYDVTIVRRVAPDLGFAESFFWPIDEPRDEIMYCPTPNNPDEDTRRWVRKWIDARRRGEEFVR